MTTPLFRKGHVYIITEHIGKEKRISIAEYMGTNIMKSYMTNGARYCYGDNIMFFRTLTNHFRKLKRANLHIGEKTIRRNKIEFSYVGDRKHIRD